MLVLQNNKFLSAEWDILYTYFHLRGCRYDYNDHVILRQSQNTSFGCAVDTMWSIALPATS
jgi:hypothetical protein